MVATNNNLLTFKITSKAFDRPNYRKSFPLGSAIITLGGVKAARIFDRPFIFTFTLQQYRTQGVVACIRAQNKWFAVISLDENGSRR